VLFGLRKDTPHIVVTFIGCDIHLRGVFAAGKSNCSLTYDTLYTCVTYALVMCWEIIEAAYIAQR
jgi:hypothetical protein